MAQRDKKEWMIQMEWYRLNKKYLTLYIELVIASVLYVIPVILADRYYNDDLSRALYGARGWQKDGRPLGDVLMILLTGGGQRVVDISPLPLLVGIFVLSYALVLYAREHMDTFSRQYVKIPVLLFIITNPLAMSNWSYKYDSIMMLCSVSIPFIVFSMQAVSKKKTFFLGFFAGAVVMSLYQPAIGICLVLFMTEILLYILAEKDDVKKEFVRISGIMAGTFFYMLFIAPVCVDSQGWRHKESQMILGMGFQAAKVIINNLVNCCRYIQAYICGASWLYGVILCLIMLFLTGALIQKNQLISLKCIPGIYCIISPAFAFIATFLPVVCLKTVEMRSRLFISLGSFFLYIGFLLLYLLEKSRRRIVNIMITVLLVSCVFFHFIFMYTYGNALKCQKEYEKYVVYHIAHDIEILNEAEALQKITFIGDAPKARQVQMMFDKYPFLEELVPIYLDNSTWLGGVWLYHYLQEGLLIEEAEADDLQIVISEEPELANTIYDCYLKEEKIIICFR